MDKINKKEIQIFNSTLKKINSLNNKELKHKFSNSKVSTFYSLNRNFSDIFIKTPETKNFSTPRNHGLALVIKNFNHNLEFFSNRNNKNNNNLVIYNLLNKKLKIKLDEINVENIKIKNNKHFFEEKYEKFFQKKEKPLNYYLRKNKNLNNKKSLNNFSIKLYNKLLKKPTYETIEFKDKKLLYANKLKFDENDKIFIEYPKNIIGSLSCNRTNFKSLSNTSNKKTIRKEFSLNNLRIMNIKKLEKMRKDKYLTLKKSIIESNEIIKNNRIEYNSFINRISNIFNNQVEEIKKNDL